MVFTINGVSYNKKTDFNGRAGLPINLLPKSYNAKVSFSAKGYVWKFHFATSFSFSLVEQLVGNSIWNTTKIGKTVFSGFTS